MESKEPLIYTEEQLMARLKFFIGICLSLTLTGIVFVVLYSLIFVTQPLNAISPMDQKFFELIVPIATFLTGTLSGIMLAGNDKELRAKALEAANKPPPVSPPPTPPTSFTQTTTTFGSGGGFGSPTIPPAGFPAPNPFGGPTIPQPDNWGQVSNSSKGKPMPGQPPFPEL